MRFTIESVSKMTGIPASSLRNWEKRYGFPKPERTPAGHRFYSVEDVQFLKEARVALLEGQPLARLAPLYEERRRQWRSRAEADPRGNRASDVVDDVEYRVELLYEALLGFRAQAVLQHYQILNSKLSPEQMFDRVFERIFRRLGSDWAAGEISVAQEHYASAFLRLRLSSFLTLEFPATREETLLAATTEGERHEGGLMLISAHLKFRGFRLVYAGTDLPLEDVKNLARETRVAAICLSYANAELLVRDLPKLSQMKVPVCLGGIAMESKSIEGARRKTRPPVHLCDRQSGTQAADFVEMVCQDEILQS